MTQFLPGLNSGESRYLYYPHFCTEFCPGETYLVRPVMSSELDLLRQENAKLMGENAVLMAKIVELEQTAKENAELKARVTKLEENTELRAKDISSNTGSSNSNLISSEDKEVE